MVNLLKRFCWVVLLAAGLQNAPAFVTLGPIANGGDTWQITTYNYGVGSDLGAPKNLYEEYRWNIPILYYSFDQNFFEYFGSNGVLEVEKAIAFYNDLTNVSAYTPELSEFSTETREINYTAQALHLFDLKSEAMSLLAEQFGLGEPERWTWSIHGRAPIPNLSCPFFTYVVDMRNWNPVTWEPTAYVNGNLLNYLIFQSCSPDSADAIEIPADPLANLFSAVASLGNTTDYGTYYTGLTRDDVGGLRYLWSSNNINLESSGPGVLQIYTNVNVNPSILTTSNLSLLAAEAYTNDAPALVALNPGLVVTSTTNFFVLEVTTNSFAYFTNMPGAPAGSPATLKTFTTYTTNLVIRFKHTFGNVVTNNFFTNGRVSTVTISSGSCPGAPAGYPCPPVTNVSSVISSMVMGDYYLVPTNTCGISIISLLFSNVLSFTNDIVLATNAVGVTNVGSQVFSQSRVTYFTNFQFAVRPVICLSNTPALRQGIEKMRLVRRDYDSEFGQFFYPTNSRYTLVALTNNSPTTQMFLRAVTEPDILFSARDLLVGIVNAISSRSIIWSQSNTLNGLAGPGTILPPVTFRFNKVGPVIVNQYPAFLTDTEQLNPSQAFQWGSFDGTTNAPILYPSYRSLTNLQNQIFMDILPNAPIVNGSVQLPDGTVGMNYALSFAGFNGKGGQPPYFWELSTESPGGMPPGLTLNPNGTITGSPSNSTAGLTYDIVVRMTDAGTRFVDRPYAIKFNP